MLGLNLFDGFKILFPYRILKSNGKIMCFFGSILKLCGCFILYTTIAVFKATCFQYFHIKSLSFGFAKLSVYLIYWYLEVELKTKADIFLSSLD